MVASVHFQIFPGALALRCPEDGYLGRVILQKYDHSGGLATRTIDCAISFDATAIGLAWGRGSAGLSLLSLLPLCLISFVLSGNRCGITLHLKHTLGSPGKLKKALSAEVPPVNKIGPLGWLVRSLAGRLPGPFQHLDHFTGSFPVWAYSSDCPQSVLRLNPGSLSSPLTSCR